jgi:hypothetical protein
MKGVQNLAERGELAQMLATMRDVSQLMNRTDRKLAA